MQLFLSQDVGDAFDDVLFAPIMLDIVSIATLCDVVEKLGEEGDLEKLVEGNESQAGEGVILRRDRWWCSVWKTSVCLSLNDSDLLRRWVGKAVAERVVGEGKGSCSNEREA